MNVIKINPFKDFAIFVLSSCFAATLSLQAKAQVDWPLELLLYEKSTQKWNSFWTPDQMEKEVREGLQKANIQEKDAIILRQFNAYSNGEFMPFSRVRIYRKPPFRKKTSSTNSHPPHDPTPMPIGN